MFSSNAKRVKELYDFAELKNREADIKLKMYADKLSNFNAEEGKIREQSKQEAKDFLRMQEEEKTTGHKNGLNRWI